MAMRDYANDQLVDKGHEADWICGPTKDHKTCLVFYFGLIDPKLPNDMEEHEADAYIAGILAEADLAYEGIWGRFVTQGERRARSARWVKKKVPSEVRQFHGNTNETRGSLENTTSRGPSPRLSSRATTLLPSPRPTLGRSNR
jgi:hypothetical protein